MLRNCYKQDDIFVCRHEAHRGFAYQVSAYHVLREKACFPRGCVDFRWRCLRLERGQTCDRGLKHVGRPCGSCRHFRDEKIHRYPELRVSEEEYHAFLDECRRFDEWLEDHVGQRLEVGGRVTEIRPHLVKTVDGRRQSLRLRGFLLRLDPGYMGRDGFRDGIYLHISGPQQDRARVAAGDSVDALGVIRFDRGRLVADSIRRLRVEERSGEEPARWNRALLDQAGAVQVPGQAERCLRCERGLLIDIEDLEVRDRRGPRREMLCLEGIGRPEDCPYEALRALQGGRPID